MRVLPREFLSITNACLQDSILFREPYSCYPNGTLEESLDSALRSSPLVACSVTRSEVLLLRACSMEWKESLAMPPGDGQSDHLIICLKG